MKNHNCKQWQQFATTISIEDGEDIAQRIVEAMCNDQKLYATIDGLTIDCIHQHNACNHTISGSIVYNDIEYGFVVDCGDLAGTVFRKWGLAEDIGSYDPPPSVVYDVFPILEPGDQLSKFAFARYLQAKESGYYNKLIVDYTYDNHFALSGETTLHYKKAASSLGVALYSQQYVNELIQSTRNHLHG